jgi:hypothetical protein
VEAGGGVPGPSTAFPISRGPRSTSPA